jgi:site-specific recombinase XerD
MDTAITPAPEVLAPLTAASAELQGRGFEVPPDRHPVLVYLARLAPGSRRTMRQSLETMVDLLTSGRLTAETVDWSAIRYQHTAAIRAALIERFAPATANKMLSALRGVLKEAWRLGYLDAETYHRARDLPAIRGESLLRGRALAAGELRVLFAACAEDPGPAGARDAAVVAVLYGAGLRRSEAAALDLADYDPEAGGLTVRAGKGRKARLTYLGEGGSRAVNAWIRCRGEAAGPLFLPVNKGKKIQQRRMTDQALLYLLRKRAREGVMKGFSPHDLRRTFISDLLDAGADIAIVQKLAGHANVTTTARYDRRGEATKRRAAGLLHVPFGG